MDKNYGEMTMAELKAELVKKQNELAEVHKVVKPLHESYVEDMTKYMTNKVREELLQTQRKVRTIYWDIKKIDSEIRALERNDKREEVMKEIKVGTVIMTNKSRDYKATITRMGKKCVFINYGGWRDSRYEIDDVVNRVVNGSWEIVK